ncbi:hypothetical protein EJ04DRAFT_522449 [Polyplosphaeria fusca]|uniref:Uncharacterized protein n=1 Tax=Polyplosphaeria fusca TaxID=682080 RepID=A0A9P4R3F9_9PLEO|nr:hypothetical protein EJ04DRAFT_522449 [Polyplosphaeria fusca]
MSYQPAQTVYVCLGIAVAAEDNKPTFTVTSVSTLAVDIATLPGINPSRASNSEPATLPDAKTADTRDPTSSSSTSMTIHNIVKNPAAANKALCISLNGPLTHFKYLKIGWRNDLESAQNLVEEDFNNIKREAISKGFSEPTNRWTLVDEESRCEFSMGNGNSVVYEIVKCPVIEKEPLTA